MAVAEKSPRCKNGIAVEGKKMKNEADVEGLPEEVHFLFRTYYRCTLCKCRINGRVNIEEHVDGIHHQDKLRLWKEKKSKIPNNADVAPANTQNDQLLPQDVVMADNSNFFWCKTCSAKIIGYKCVIQHVKGQNHNKKEMGLSTSTLNINSNSSKSHSKINANKGLQLAPTKIRKESLPSSSISQVNCSSAQRVNVQESGPSMAKKKKKDSKKKKQVIYTSNIVSASTQKIQCVVKMPSSGKKVGACEIYPEKKKSPGMNNSFNPSVVVPPRQRLKLFDIKNSISEHVKSLIHMNNQRRSLGSREREENEVFFNEINWKTSEKSAGGEETTTYSLFPNSQWKDAGGPSLENDFFSCSSEKVPKINAGPSEAQMIASMAQLTLNSEKNEKANWCLNANCCMKFNCFLLENELHSYLYGKYHRETLGSNGIIQDMQIFHCEPCDHDVIGKKRWEAHTLLAEHKKNERVLPEDSSREVSDKASAENPRKIEPLISNFRSSAKTSKSSAKLSTEKGQPSRNREQHGSGSKKLLKIFDRCKAVCPICQSKVLGSNEQLHSHLTSHFWRRFTKNPPPIAEMAPEEPAKSKRSNCTGDSDDEFLMNESLMKTVKRTRFRSKPLDIEVTGSTNIYEIDGQKMNEIKAGVHLSLSKDKDTIYCLICQRNVSNNLQTFYEHLCSIKHFDYLRDMLDDDKLFQNSENQFSVLALGYEYMEDLSETAVKCHACDTSIKNKFSKLHKHINSASHIDKWAALDENSRELFRRLKSKMECDFYSIRKYWCVICNSKFITECGFQKHLKRRKHLEESQKFCDQFLMFDYCKVCASLWYGFLETFSYHSACPMHKYHKLDGFFSIDKLPESAECLLNSSEEEIGDILRGLEFRRAIDKSEEDQLLRDLREIAVVRFPNAVAHPFGSRITGLGGKDSDLDVFLDCPTKNSCMYFGENSHPELIKRRLVKIKESLENDTNIWHVDREILDCRIPIIKIKHKPTDIECDLSFTNGLTVENTALIRNYCDKSTDCRKLIIFIKNWMNHCELSGANGINSYGIAWLVIYFLQTKKILPTVNQLIEMNNKSQLIAGWETGVSKDFQVQTFAGSFGELLNEFFKFYGNFDYRHDVICPLLGEIVKKIDFQHRDKLPSAMGPYLNYLHDTRDTEPFRVDSIMCLQDPFDLAHNITKAVKKFTIYKFRKFCYYSTEIVDNNV